MTGVSKSAMEIADPVLLQQEENKLSRRCHKRTLYCSFLFFFPREDVEAQPEQNGSIGIREEPNCSVFAHVLCELCLSILTDSHQENWKAHFVEEIYSKIKRPTAVRGCWGYPKIRTGSPNTEERKYSKHLQVQ
jgi:hypothetical protein